MSRMDVPCVHQVPDEDGLWEFADDCRQAVTVVYEIEAGWGADADGRRGTTVAWLEEIIQPGCTCALTEAEKDRLLDMACDTDGWAD